MNEVIKILYLDDDVIHQNLLLEFFKMFEKEFSIHKSNSINKFSTNEIVSEYNLILISNTFFLNQTELQLNKIIDIVKVNPIPLVLAIDKKDDDLVINALKLAPFNFVLKGEENFHTYPIFFKNSVESFKIPLPFINKKPDKLKVLHIDDSLDILELVSVSLVGINTIKLTSLNSVDSAMELIRKGQKFDLIITDLVMTEMSGLMVVIKIINLDLQVPIIVLTGKGDEKNAVTSLKLGASDYLIKEGNYLEVLPALITTTVLKYSLQEQNKKLKLKVIQKNLELEKTVEKRTAKLIGEIEKRKKKEIELKDTQEKLQALITNNEEIIFFIDENGIIKISEGKGHQKIGFKPGENVGLSIFNMYQDYPLIIENFKKAFAGEKVVFEVEVDGNYFNSVYIPQFNQKTQKYAVLGMSVNITELKLKEFELIRAKEKAEENEEKFKALLENIGEIVYVIDQEGTFVLSEGKGLEKIGLKPGEVVGLNVFELYKNFPEMLDDIKRVLKGERIEKEEEVNGYYFKTFYSPYFNTDTQKYWLMGLSVNISILKKKEFELVEAKEKAEESSERLKSIYDNSKLGFYRTTPGGEIVMANMALAKMLEFDTVDDLKKRNLNTNSFTSYSREEFIKSADKKDMIIGLEAYWETKTNNSIFVRESVNVVRDKEGKIKYYDGFVEDISEKKLIEKELVTSRNNLRNLTKHIEDLREKDRAHFALDLHDDLGQRLSGIKMQFSWLKDRIPEQNLKQSTLLMDNLINDTIKAVQTIATKLRPSILKNLGLIEAIKWQIAEVEKMAHISCVAKIELDNITASDEWATMVFRIIQESLTNIMRYANATVINLSVKKRNNNLVIRIKDNGKGITKEQINSPDSFGLQGMKERVKSFNGKMFIKGEKNAGTFLIFEIPLETESRV